MSLFQTKSNYLIAGLLVFWALTASAKDEKISFVGIEFYGPSHFDRAQLTKLVNLPSEVSATKVTAAADRLSKYLLRSNIKANVEVVSAGQDQIALAVDVVDPNSNLISRRLNAPHHVFVTSEQPFILLDKLNLRLATLAQQGRPAIDEWHHGYKYSSDEPANQLINQIRAFVPSLRAELLQVVDSDPDPLRRVQAIQLLGWCAETDDTAANLLSALDDGDGRVRVECARYIYARSASLSDSFPFDALVQGLARMLQRPSHQDRSKSLYCLVSLCTCHKNVLPMAKSLCEDEVIRLSKESILPSVKDNAQVLAALFAGVSPAKLIDEDPGI